MLIHLPLVSARALAAHTASMRALKRWAAGPNRASVRAVNTDSRVCFEDSRNGSLLVRLNRPDALNALDEGTTGAISRRLASVQQRVCVVGSTSERALCAGGARSAAPAPSWPCAGPPAGG
jgi:hypothetical protein